MFDTEREAVEHDMHRLYTIRARRGALDNTSDPCWWQKPWSGGLVIAMHSMLTSRGSFKNRQHKVDTLHSLVQEHLIC